jgi:hypothetical protein
MWSGEQNPSAGTERCRITSFRARCPYSPECVEDETSEVRTYSSHIAPTGSS